MKPMKPIKTNEDKEEALERWSKLVKEYEATYGKKWNCRSKQGNQLDDEIFELWDALHQYDKLHGDRW